MPIRWKAGLCCLFLGSVFTAAAVAQTTRLITGVNDMPPIDAANSAISVSASGRFVLTSSLYLIDLLNDTETQVGFLPGGGGATAVAGDVSDDGKFITWVERRNAPALYYRDIDAGVTRDILTGTNGRSDYPKISSDGRFVAFASTVRTLVAADQLPSSDGAAVYYFDSQNDSFTAVSLGTGDIGLASGLLNLFDFDISRDAQYVFYSTDAANAHPDRAMASSSLQYWMYRRRIDTGVVDIVNRNAMGEFPSGSFNRPVAGPIGRFVAFSGANVGLGDNGSLTGDGYNNIFGADIYRRDFDTGQIVRVSETLSGAAGDGAYDGIALGGDGSFVLFESTGTNHVAEPTDPQGTGTTDGSFDAFRADIVGGDVTITWLSVPEMGGANVFSDAVIAPVSGSYSAFTTNQWETMLDGRTNSSLWDNTIGIGEFVFDPDDGVFDSGFEGF